MFIKLLRSVMLGMVIAGILLAALPALRLGGTGALLNHDDSDDKTPFSFNAGVRRAVPAVVNVYNRSAHDNNRGINTLGSGVIMNAKGYILTNKHVINNADQIIVALQNGRFFEANLVGSDTMTDLAVLKITTSSLPVILINPHRVPHRALSATGRVGLSSSGRQNFL